MQNILLFYCKTCFNSKVSHFYLLKTGKQWNLPKSSIYIKNKFKKVDSFSVFVKILNLLLRKELAASLECSSFDWKLSERSSGADSKWNLPLSLRLPIKSLSPENLKHFEWLLQFLAPIQLVISGHDCTGLSHSGSANCLNNCRCQRTFVYKKC